MAATRAASSGVARAQNPAYRLALPLNKKMPAPIGTSAFLFESFVVAWATVLAAVMLS